jgi:integrase|tara:strand:- start:5370 stop:6260 length:891 start_codon:yes stop_codon:yes gene_type:complete
MLANDDLSFYGNTTVLGPDINAFMDEHLKVRKRISINTYNTARTVVNSLTAYLKSINVNTISDITIKVLNGYIDYLSCSAKTKKNHMIEIRQMLKRAVIEGILKNNPAKHVTLPRIIKSEIHRPLDQYDLLLIFKHAGSWRLYFEFLYRTGLRAGDVAMLTYGNIDTKRKVIVSLIRKSRRIHEVPLGNQLLEKIDNLAGNKPLFPILYSQSERKLKDNLAKPRKFLQSILKANGRKKATLHSFRVTFNNTLRDMGLSIDDRAVLLTHSSSETTKIYTHPNLNLAFEYINKMPDFN